MTHIHGYRCCVYDNTECTKAVTYAVKMWELGGIFQDPATEVAHLGLNQPLILY